MKNRITIWVSSLLFSAGLITGVASGQGKGDAAKGKATFEQCAMCHNVDSPDRKMGPSLQGLFKHKALVNGKPVSDDNVMAQINNGGNGMPPYGDALSKDEKADLLAYLHTL